MRDGLTVAVLLVLGLLALAGARSGARREVEQVCRHAIQREYRVGAAEAQRVIDNEKARTR